MGQTEVWSWEDKTNQTPLDRKENQLLSARKGSRVEEEEGGVRCEQGRRIMMMVGNGCAAARTGETEALTDANQKNLKPRREMAW